MRFKAPEAPSVSVVVLGWRDAPKLSACLQSLADHATEHPFEVVVALNDPTPELSDRLAQSVEGVEVLVLPANTGYSGGCNRAAARARGEHIVLLNDDCTVTEGWLDALMAVILTRPEVGAVGSRQVGEDGSVLEAGSLLWHDGTVLQVGPGLSADLPVLAQSRPVDHCSGASLLVRRSTWEAVGGLDPAFFPAYYEDVDLCLKIAARGQLVWYAAGSVVEHASGSSTTFPYRQFLARRNQRLLMERWGAELATREPLPSKWDGETLTRAVARTTERIERRRQTGVLLVAAPRPVTMDRPMANSGTGPPDVERFLRAELAVHAEYEGELEQATAELATATLRIAELQAAREETLAAHERAQALIARLDDQVQALEAARRQAVDEVAFLRSRPGYQLVDRINAALNRLPGARRVARAVAHGLQRGST